MCAEPARIGILGGTFDPVHLGHIVSALEIADAFSLDRVLLVLAPRPPHKPGDAAAPAAMRWKMLQLAVDEAAAAPPADPAVAREGPFVLAACDLEMHRDGPSFTVDTLRDLGGRHPGAELFLIVGIDAYREIDTWSRPGEIPRLANIIVTSRPGVDSPASPPPPPVAARADARYDPVIGAYVHTSGHRIVGHRIHGLEVSATDIRRCVRSGLPVAHLTGEAVARFIAEHRLYAAGPSAVPPGPTAAASRRTP